ncbi:unnamed protein product [Rhizophagus irregularis]|nr:unnamed protein product [Rhizophagus irregularis]
MSTQIWFEELKKTNEKYVNFQRADRTWLVRDDTKLLNILPCHHVLSKNDHAYQLCTIASVKPDPGQTKCWVPLIPGYSIMSKIGTHFLRLSISESNNILQFEWIDYGNDSTFRGNPIASGRDSKFFQSLRQYVENQRDIKGKISIPSILGLNIYENAMYLRSVIYHLHSEMFLSSKEAYSAITKMNKFTKSLNKRALELDKECEEEGSPNKKVKSGLIFSTSGHKLTPRQSQALVFKFHTVQNKFYQANKRLKRAQNNLEKLRTLLPSPKQNNNKKQKELLDEKIRQLKNDENLGSSIICSTESFLSLALTQQCSCGNNDISQKKCKISSGGLSVKVVIQCKKCKETSSFQNEPSNVNYTKAFAAATLCSGLNRQEFQNAMLTIGITKLPSKTIYHKYQKSMSENIKNVALENTRKALYASIDDAKKKGKNVLTVGFDTSWSHVRNASQASGEFIYHGIPEGYTRKPVVGYFVVEKSRVKKDKNGNKTTVHQGNHEASSKQMEHAVLIGILEIVVPILEETDMLLDIVVDGDLDSNKTLRGVKCVNKIFPDLKHLTRNIRKKLNSKKWERYSHYEDVILQYYKKCIFIAAVQGENKKDLPLTTESVKYAQVYGLTKHLCGDHSECWPEVCWIAQNPELALCEPNLLNSTSEERKKFTEMLGEVFQLNVGQSLITDARTSQNEAFNRQKLSFVSKLIDYWKTYSVRHALAVIHNNSSLLAMLQNVRTQAELDTFSENDVQNIEHIAGRRELQRQRNHQDMDTQKAAKVAKIVQQKKNLEMFDFDQSLVPYGQKTRVELESKTFCPSFADLIDGFYDVSNKCIGCQSFPKQFPNGYCKICNLWNDLGFIQRIPENKVQITDDKLPFSKHIPDLNQILKQVFGFSNFREGQYEAICSFLEYKDTLVVLRTGGGKTLCFAMAALASFRLTVVFTPLKALIDDHVNSLVRMGIPAAGLYASTGQSFEYQERVFSELSLGILPILFVTPEKLEKNKSFHQFLQKIYETRGIQFVIDEAHCILDYNNFRDSWTRLGNLKKDFPISPIMLLTATCTTSDVEDIRQNLNILPTNFTIIRGTSLARQEIDIQVISKPSKQNLYSQIQNILVGLTTGRCIIYCSGPSSCQELFHYLHENLSALSFGLYHGELDGEQRKMAIRNWKTGIIQIMIAINGFDISNEACGLCDNCLLNSNNNPVWNNFSADVVRLLKIAKEILESRKISEMIPLDIAAVFCKLKRANELGLSELSIYNELFERKIKNKENVLFVIDDLCVKGFLILNFQLRKTAALTKNFSFKPIIVGLGDNAEEEVTRITWQYCFKQ